MELNWYVYYTDTPNNAIDIQSFCDPIIIYISRACHRHFLTLYNFTISLKSLTFCPLNHTISSVKYFIVEEKDEWAFYTQLITS